MKSYILAGQSNMDGHGLIASLPSALTGTIPGVQILNGSSFVNLVAGSTNLGADSTKFGPELSFGKIVQEHYAEDIKLVKYAVGGTPLAQWADPLGDWNPASTGELFDTLAAKCATAWGILGAPDGVIWMQGETDSWQPAMAPAYKRNLKAFISALRSSVGVANLPFYCAKIRGPDTGDLYTINELIRQCALEDANVHVVETSGCALSGDLVHFSAAGQVALGEAFAAAVTA